MPETRREKVGSYLVAAVVLVPALIAAGFMPLWDVLPYWGWVAVAGFGGGAAGAVWDAERPALGALAAGVFGGLVLVAVPAYVAARSVVGSTYLSVELLLPVGLAALPSLGLYRLAGPSRSGGGAEGEPAPGNPYEPPRP